MKTELNVSFREGWNIFYQARTLFVTLLIISMVVNIAIFLTAKYSKLLTPILTPSGDAVVSCPLTTSCPSIVPLAVNSYSNTDMARSNRWSEAFKGMLTITGIISVVSAIFLVFCGFIGLMMLIAGQLPGAGKICAAFFWGVGLLVLLLLWSNMLPNSAGLPVGITGFTELQSSLLSANISSGAWIGQITLWLRFVIYPLIIILLTIVYLRRTMQANMEISPQESIETDTVIQEGQ